MLEALRAELGVVCRLLDCLPSLAFVFVLPPTGAILGLVVKQGRPAVRLVSAKGRVDTL